MAPLSLPLLCLYILVALTFSVPVGDRVAYYVSRHTNNISIKIEKVKPTSKDWKIEEVFWAFDKPVDDCIPITVYQYPATNGHGITQYGDQNIIFWFFAYDSINHPSLQHINPTQYDVYQNNETFHIWKERNINISTLSINDKLLFSFYAFEYDDKYIENITVNNCNNCSLIPSFKSEIYSYYIIVADNVKNVYFTTNPSENVTFTFDDATYLLTEQEALEKKLNQIVSYKVGQFENINSLNSKEIKEILLSFYNKNEIDNNTINQYVNNSLYEWISEFVQDDTKHNLIETTYKSLSAEIESNPIGNNTNNNNNDQDTLDSDGLLHEAWTPVTVDIHYDLHHYRIFVIRKSGQFDMKQFVKSMELNKNAFLRISSRKCPDISLDAIVQNDIPEWWDNIRVWVVSFTVFTIMATYICYDRYSYFQLVQKHQALYQS